VDYVAVREGKNLKGRVLGIVLETIGEARLEKAFDGAVRAIEVRDDGAKAAEVS
jgi:hypothetical protein